MASSSRARPTAYRGRRGRRREVPGRLPRRADHQRPGDTTYPIAAYTYLLVYQDQKDATKGQALVDFLYWALTDGQKEEKALGYAPLPAPIQQKALDELHKITTGGAAIWPM